MMVKNTPGAINDLNSKRVAKTCSRVPGNMCWGRLMGGALIANRAGFALPFTPLGRPVDIAFDCLLVLGAGFNWRRTTCDLWHALWQLVLGVGRQGFRLANGRRNSMDLEASKKLEPSRMCGKGVP